MRRLAHISDLHFGRVDERVVAALYDDLVETNTERVIVTGDLVQRARRRQFQAAKAFLDSLPMPVMVVPGNHDLPVWNIVGRFTDPLGPYMRYISRDLSPVWRDDEIAILGVTTARSWILDFAEGRINRTQINRVIEVFGTLPSETFKILFTHHPFLPPPGAPDTRLVGRAEIALKALETSGVDLLLAGHLHRAYHGDVSSHHTTIRRSILVAQAATATSTRLRDEPNAWNLIDIEPPDRLTLQIRTCEGLRFHAGRTTRFVKKAGSWRAVATDEPALQTPADPAASGRR